MDKQGISDNGWRLIFFVFALCFFYPLWLKAQRSDSLSILFVGDLMQHDAQINSARRDGAGYDYSGCYAAVAQEFKQNDVVVGNLEVTLGGKPYRGYPAFSAPDEFLYATRRAGVNVMMTANNHCLDRGKRGLRRTIALLDSLRIPHAGTYCNLEERNEKYPLLVEQGNFRIVFLNYTYGTNGIGVNPPNVVNYIDRDLIYKDIRKARLMRPDVIIACMHWGVEYQHLPRKEEKELAAWMIEQGVNHVIGSHPHVIQPIVVFPSQRNPADSHLVVYSLGNFISNMSAPGTDGGLIVQLKLRKVEGHTYMNDCRYAFVWTSRPALSGKSIYKVYPVNVDSNLLNDNEILKRNHFVKASRQLFKEYTKGINEYFFLKRNRSKSLQIKK